VSHGGEGNPNCRCDTCQLKAALAAVTGERDRLLEVIEEMGTVERGIRLSLTGNQKDLLGWLDAGHDWSGWEVAGAAGMSPTLEFQVRVRAIFAVIKRGLVDIRGHLTPFGCDELRASRVVEMRR
jgi:hypothetical protein